MVLTEKGFKRPTYDELLSRQLDRAKALFGENIDTSEQSILGKYLRIDVQDLSECYELLEDIYYARFPNSARGQSLDRLCTFAGIVRDPATYARLNVRFYGKKGATIPAAFLISGNGMIFYVDTDYTIGSDGECDAMINCTKSGIAGNLPVGTELTIINPSSDLEKVEYVSVESYGQEKESDAALRIRFNKSISGSGSATMNAIRGAIARVPLVEGVTIVENDTDETINDLPPHSFECYVLAPESQDQLIAAAIFEKKPLGIKCMGSEEVQVLDNSGKSHTIRFSRTIEKTVSVKLKVKINQYFETEGNSQIKDNLLEYINNLANGESVYLSGLYGHIHKVHGVVNVQELLIAADNSEFKPEDILIGDYEIARSSGDNIEIEVVK